MFPVFQMVPGLVISLHHKSISSGDSMIFSHSSRLFSCRAEGCKTIASFLVSNLILSRLTVPRIVYCPLSTVSSVSMAGMISYLSQPLSHLSPSISLLSFSQPSPPLPPSPQPRSHLLMPQLPSSLLTPCFTKQDVGREESLSTTKL